MAKDTSKTAAIEDIYAGLSPEQVAEMLALTGQSNNASHEKAPVLKINYYGKKDVDGNKVDVGNFVMGQDIKIVDSVKTCNFIGKDFGANPEITVLKVATQYSYYNDSKEKRCSSQIIVDRNEKAVGNTLKFECNSGKCPRRQKDLDKKEKCSCQFIVYLEIGKDKDQCLMYVKGASYMPFKEYLDAAGANPLFFFPTVLNTKEKTHGAVDYYEIYPFLDTARPYPLPARLENFATAKLTTKGLEDYKLQAAAQKQVAYSPEIEVLGVEGGTSNRGRDFDNDSDIKF
jgi:hypothetical protein